MSTVSVRLPESLHKRARELAKREGTSINQLVSSALAEKISALEAQEYLEHRGERAGREKFRKALKKVADTEAEAFDK